MSIGVNSYNPVLTEGDPLSEVANIFMLLCSIDIFLPSNSESEFYDDVMVRRTHIFGSMQIARKIYPGCWV